MSGGGGRPRAAGKKRQAQGNQQPQTSSKKGRGSAGKKVDKASLYEAEEVEADEIKNVDRYDDVENYQYEMPEDFEDEEIDEEMAFSAEDKIK